MLREIIERAVTGQPDMEIVDDILPSEIVPEALRQARADVVISAGHHDSATLNQVLCELPRLKVLVVSADGRETALHELRPNRMELGEVSPQTIVDAIRGACRATTS
jgi:DNA-binding NarL/FixJ family response regulator